jgi:hypothetical protein
MGYLILLNSWGKSVPHYLKLTLEDAERVIFREDGECTVVTDR